MAYHTLAIQDGTPTNEPWGIAFGDYDLDTVKAERDDFRDHGWKARELRIITTRTARQSEIDAAIAKLNAS